MGYGADEPVALEELVTADPEEEPVAVAVEDFVDEESEPDEIAGENTVSDPKLHDSIGWLALTYRRFYQRKHRFPCRPAERHRCLLWYCIAV